MLERASVYCVNLKVLLPVRAQLAPVYPTYLLPPANRKRTGLRNGSSPIPCGQGEEIQQLGGLSLPRRLCRKGNRVIFASYWDGGDNGRVRDFLYAETSAYVYLNL